MWKRGFALSKTAKDWMATAIVLALVQCTASALLPKGVALSAVSDSASSLLFVALIVCFARNAVPARGRLRLFWILQAFGWTIALASQLIWTMYDVFLQKDVPTLFIGDVLPFLPGILMLAGFLLRPHIEQTRRGARLGTIHFLLLMLWWVFFYIYLVSGWQFASPNEELYNRNYDRLYLFETLAVASVLLHLVRRSAGPWRRFYLLYLDLAGHAARLHHFTELSATFHAVVNGLYAEVIAQGIAAGAFGVEEPEEGAVALRAIIDGLFLQWLQEADWERLHPWYRETCKRAALSYLIRTPGAPAA